MQPTLLPPDTRQNASNGLFTARGWLVQAALLFGLLMLGRSSRPAPDQLRADQNPPSVSPSFVNPAAWRHTPKPAETGVALPRLMP